MLSPTDMNDIDVYTITVRYTSQGCFNDAKISYLHAINSTPNSKKKNLATLLNGLASLYCFWGKYSDIGAVRDKAELICTTEGDELGLADSLYIKAFFQSCSMAETDETRVLYEKALEIRKRMLVPGHADIALSLYGLGLYNFNQNNLKDALHLYIEALEIRKALDPHHRDTGMSFCHLGGLYIAQGEHELALDALKHAQNIQMNLEPNHIDIARTLSNMATLLYCQQNYVNALDHFMQALTIEKCVFGSHLLTAATHFNIGNCYRSLSDVVKAEQHFRSSLKIRKRILGDEHRDTIQLMQILADCLEEQQQYDRAIHMRVEMLSICKLNGQDTLELVLKLVGLFERTSQFERALLMLTEFRAPDRKTAVKLLTARADIYVSQSMYTYAESDYWQVLCLQEELRADYLECKPYLHNLAAVYIHQQNPKAAHDLFIAARGIFHEFGDDISITEILVFENTYNGLVERLYRQALTTLKIDIPTGYIPRGDFKHFLHDVDIEKLPTNESTVEWLEVKLAQMFVKQNVLVKNTSITLRNLVNNYTLSPNSDNYTYTYTDALNKLENLPIENSYVVFFETIYDCLVEQVYTFAIDHATEEQVIELNRRKGLFYKRICRMQEANTLLEGVLVAYKKDPLKYKKKIKALEQDIEEVNALL